jgi:hypothetical protein
MFPAAHGGRGYSCRPGRPRSRRTCSLYDPADRLTHKVDGSTTIDVKAFIPDDSLANETLSTTSGWRWK